MKEDTTGRQDSSKVDYISGPKWDNSWQKKNNGIWGRSSSGYSNYRPYRSPLMPPNKLGEFLRQRIIYQVLISLFIFAVAIIGHDGEDPLRKTVAQGFSYLMNTQINYEPILTKVVKIALSNEVLDWPHLQPAEETPVKTVTQSKVMSLPVSGSLTKRYGWVEDPLDNYPRFHEGVDIKAKLGSSVQAVMDGKVTKIGEDKILGRYIQIHHAGELATLYAHLSKVAVQKGDLVKEGEVVGKVGDSGIATEAHLHFEVREKGQLVDPVIKMNLPGKEAM